MYASSRIGKMPKRRQKIAIKRLVSLDLQSKAKSGLFYNGIVKKIWFENGLPAHVDVNIYPIKPIEKIYFNSKILLDRASLTMPEVSADAQVDIRHGCRWL